MSNITTRDHLEEAPEVGEPDAAGSSIQRVVTLARCSRCEFEWLPRKANPVKCPHCQSALWNVPRANRKQGKPEPTRKGKPRGRTMTPPQSTEKNQTKV